jgi:hypothetical protein
MGHHLMNESDLGAIMHSGDQAIVIALDVEADIFVVITNWIGTAEGLA